LEGKLPRNFRKKKRLQPDCGEKGNLVEQKRGDKRRVKNSFHQGVSPSGKEEGGK